jgi:hypothetical protein
MVTAVKTCTLCGENQPLTAYPPDRRERDGRAARCRDCHNLAREVSAAGGLPLQPAAPTGDHPSRAAIHVCLHPEARPGACGECLECGLPIVALMRPGPRAKMDAKWPGWRDQVVLR